MRALCVSFPLSYRPVLLTILWRLCYMGNLRCRLLLYYVKARSVVCCFEARANAAIKVCPIIVADSRVPFVVRLFWACVALLSQ